MLDLATLLKLPSLPEEPPNTISPSTAFDKTVSEPRVSSDTVAQPRVHVKKAATWRRGEITYPQTRYNLRSTNTGSFRSRAARHLLVQHLFSDPLKLGGGFSFQMDGGNTCGKIRWV